jgi:hypothetical protein
MELVGLPKFRHLYGVGLPKFGHLYGVGLPKLTYLERIAAPVKYWLPCRELEFSILHGQGLSLPSPLCD